MNKLVCVVFVLSCLSAIVQSQLAPVVVNPEEEATKFADIGGIILQARIQKANLPDDLLTNSLEVILNTRTAFDGCKSTMGTNHVIWQYRLCVISNLKMANMAITQLETEARDRETAAANAAAASGAA